MGIFSCSLYDTSSYNYNKATEYFESLKKAESYKDELDKYKYASKTLNSSLGCYNDTISDLNKSVQFYTDLYSRFGSGKNIGFSTENFHADKGIVILKTSATVKIKMAYNNATISFSEIYGADHISAKWAKKWNGNTIELYITPISKGVSEIKISNDLYDNPFSIIVIVK